ncbi:ankyrin repeat-containing domain protein [Dichotomocladium elegans]|nr:ankyrin repeat-containing domain protein [Dichotomocladium elegans]
MLNIPYSSPTIWEAAKSGDALALERAVMMTGLDPSLVVNMRDPDTESTPLYLSVAHSQNPFPLIEFLLLHGADPNRHNIYNVHAIHALPLHCIDPVRPMELLLQHEADPNARDGDDWTPLHYCARFCSDPLPAMELLVHHGANVNAVDVSKKSPLFALLANGDYPAVVDWLIHSAKADVSLKGDFTNQNRSTYPGTVFLQAVKYARIASLRVLVDSDISYERLKRVMNRQEFESAMEMILKFRDQNRPEDVANDMFAILLSFRQRLEDDSESLVYFERTGQMFNGMLSRRQPILGTFRRKLRPTSAITECTKDLQSTGEEQQPAYHSPNLLKRLSAFFTSQKSTVQ